MPAEKKWRHPIHKTLNFETDRYKEFQDLCWSERKSVSEKIDEMISGELEKKVMGTHNSINVQYGDPEEKHSVLLLQTDLRLWINKKEALHNARKQKYSSSELGNIIENLQIIRQKIQTGYLHKD